MRRVVYWPDAGRLVYLDEKATPGFWDLHWRAEGSPPPVSPRDDVIVLTSKYLPPGARVLEGGCGRANKVKAMADAGFRAVGIDFAQESVTQARKDYPGLDIQVGDVRSLEFPEHSFDGYWSIGVIEHFWSGYEEILSEAARVLRPAGFLFLMAPWFSPYRLRKAHSGGYPRCEFDAEPESFYQFALNREEVSVALASHGFKLLLWRGRVPEISMKEDMTAFQPQRDWLLGARGSIAKRLLRRALVRSLERWCGHSFLAVAQRP
jgi:SAM-dependent methyltransferase